MSFFSDHHLTSAITRWARFNLQCNRMVSCVIHNFFSLSDSPLPRIHGELRREKAKVTSTCQSFSLQLIYEEGKFKYIDHAKDDSCSHGLWPPLPIAMFCLRCRAFSSRWEISVKIGSAMKNNENWTKID